MFEDKVKRAKKSGHWKSRTGRARTLKTERVHTCFVEHGCRGPAFVCACVQKYVPRGGSPPFVLAWATKGALSRVGYHEISPADIPGFLSIYKDLYRRTADTLPPPWPFRPSLAVDAKPTFHQGVVLVAQDRRACPRKGE